MATYTDKMPECCMACIHSIPRRRIGNNPQEFDCNLKKAKITWSEYAPPRDCPLLPLPKSFDIGFLEKDLREYADSKFQRGEPELANGILSAVCRIKALAEKEGVPNENIKSD